MDKISSNRQSPGSRKSPSSHKNPRSRKSTDERDYQRLPHDVTAMPKDFPDGHVIAAHHHLRDQLLFAISGVMQITAGKNAWVLPPDRALVIPAGQDHSVEMRGDVQMRTLYIKTVAEVSAEIKVVKMTPLLRELILTLVAAPMDYSGNPRLEGVAELIKLELDHADCLPLNIPLPQDKRLQGVCLHVLSAPASQASLDDLAADAGASAKTLARLCQKELGMGFAEWRRRVRFAEALEHLGQGASVKVAATRAGYVRPSAFTHAFRQQFGLPPSAFRSQAPVTAGLRVFASADADPEQ